MMLMEMVGGRRNVKSNVEKSSEMYFPDWIYDHLAQDDGLRACEITSDTEEIARKMIVIGLWCIQVLLVYRPTITKVLEMFERSIDDLDMPPKQNFCETTVRCFSHISVPLFFPVKLLFSNNLTRALISHCSESSAHNLDVRSASSTRSEEISLASSENHTTTANSLSS
jgi:hypothetical protein